MKNQVSIIITTFNRTNFLEEAIQSVVKQTLKAFEIILVDDGSDEVHQLDIDRLVEAYDIRMIRLEENGGVSHARNAALKFAKGNLILFLDDDDLIHPEMIRTCVSSFDKQPNTDVVMTGGVILYEDLGNFNHLVRHVSLNSLRFRRFLTSQNYSATYFILFGMCLLHSFMFRKKVLMKYPFDENLSIGEDTYQWIFLKKRGIRFYKTNLHGAKYRLHESQISNANDISLKKRAYFEKAMELLTPGFETGVFRIMNNTLLDEAEVMPKRSWFYLLIQSPRAFFFVKYFMLLNRWDLMMVRLKPK